MGVFPVTKKIMVVFPEIENIMVVFLVLLILHYGRFSCLNFFMVGFPFFGFGRFSGFVIFLFFAKFMDVFPRLRIKNIIKVYEHVVIWDMPMFP